MKDTGVCDIPRLASPSPGKAKKRGEERISPPWRRYRDENRYENGIETRDREGRE